MTRSFPADARRSLRVYNAFFPLVFLALLPGYVLRLIRRGNYRPHFGQRFGRYSAQELAPLKGQRWTWIQSISVGETFLALKLAKAMRAADPEIRILLSTTTTTGFAMAEAQRSEWLQPIYNPIDLPAIVRRVLSQIDVEQLIVIEGGMWPNILAECYARNLPVALANARLSPRSERRFHKFRAWTGPLFRLFDSITVPDEADVARWESLGVSREKIHVTGSIKFDEPPAAPSPRVEVFRALLGTLGIAENAPILVAGSTFPGEEKMLAEMLPALREKHPGLIAIIVPRHIERTPAILQEVAPLGLAVTLRSEPKPGSEQPAILLVNTTGELRDWYALATIAIIGKSFLAIGGQNPAEPALLGRPVVFGPHMENFASLAPHLVTTGAARQVAERAELTPLLLELLGNSTARAKMSEAGPRSLASHQGAAERTAKFLRLVRS